MELYYIYENYCEFVKLKFNIWRIQNEQTKYNFLLSSAL